jgi:hypothetical protein
MTVDCSHQSVIQTIKNVGWVNCLQLLLKAIRIKIYILHYCLYNWLMRTINSHICSVSMNVNSIKIRAITWFFWFSLFINRNTQQPLLIKKLCQNDLFWKSGTALSTTEKTQEKPKNLCVVYLGTSWLDMQPI